MCQRRAGTSRRGLAGESSAASADSRAGGRGACSRTPQTTLRHAAERPGAADHGDWAGSLSARRRIAVARAEHELISALFEEVVGTTGYHNPSLAQHDTGRALLAQDLTNTGKVALAAAERHNNSLIAPAVTYTETRHWQSYSAAGGIVSPLLLNVALEVDRATLFDLLLYLAVRPAHLRGSTGDTTCKLLRRQAETEACARAADGRRALRFVVIACVAADRPGARIAWTRNHATHETDQRR